MVRGADCFKSRPVQPDCECADARGMFPCKSSPAFRNTANSRPESTKGCRFPGGQARMASQAARVRPMPAVPGDERAAIISLCRRSSIEMSVHDLPKLADCRALLPAGLQLYITHLPGQPWERTMETAAQVRARGCEPVPHPPAR